MKKKANVVFFAVFALFLCFIAGLLVGRHSYSGNVLTGHSEAVDIPSPSGQTEPPEQIGKINLNTATVTLLQSLPNIGETLAKRIVEYREENGDFAAIEDLLQVKGIGQARLEEIRQYITVGG